MHNCSGDENSVRIAITVTIAIKESKTMSRNFVKCVERGECLR